MLSRVADAIYWMHRYIERAENYARFLDVNFNLSLELPPELAEQWKPMVVTTGDWSLFESLYGENTEKSKVIYFLGFDERNPNSIFSCVVKARENARYLRPEITKEVWEQINRLYYLVKEGKEKKRWQKSDPRDFFIQVKQSIQMLHGILGSTISRNDSWHFGNIGKLLERADKTSRVLDVKYHILLPTPEAVGSPVDLIQWAALLKSVSAYDMYRKKYGRLAHVDISSFLILDKVFPRAIYHCLIHAELSMRTLTGQQEDYSNTAEKHLGKLRSQIGFTDINDIFNTGLHEFLDNFQKDLNIVSGDIFETYFSIENQINK